MQLHQSWIAAPQKWETPRDRSEMEDLGSWSSTAGWRGRTWTLLSLQEWPGSLFWGGAEPAEGVRMCGELRHSWGIPRALRILGWLSFQKVL